MKNKILTVLCICVLLSLFFVTNNVFASTTSSVTFTDISGVERTVPAFPSNDFLDSSHSYAIVRSGNYKNALYIAVGDGFFYDSGSVFCSTDCYMAYIVNDEYVIQKETVPANQRLCSAGELCYFSTGLYDGVSKNNLVYEAGGDFFQAPPQINLVQAMQVEELPTQINQIVKILVPASLVIFGILLSPFLVKYRN